MLLQLRNLHRQIRRCSRLVAASFSATSFSSDAALPASPSSLSKRKVALVAGFTGTGYHGVQINKELPTIERDLRQALFQAGCIRESNFEDLGKIMWARSSRTDKGVHASSIVFSGKLLIDDSSVDEASGRIRGLPEAINKHLPPQIRVFTCTKVNKRFSSRTSCVLREYEYWLPIKFLEENCVVTEAQKQYCAITSRQERLNLFKDTITKYQGIHDFHNFTKCRTYFYKLQMKKAEQKAAVAAALSTTSSSSLVAKEMQNFDEEFEGSDDGRDDDEDDVGSAENGDQLKDERNDPQDQACDEEITGIVTKRGNRRVHLPRYRRTLYRCEASHVSNFGGQQSEQGEYLRVRFVGQSFIFNQIRAMIGGAIAVATGGMSPELFDVALETDHIVRVPVAPGEGLVLLSNAFGGRGHAVSFYEDRNTILAAEEAEVPHRVLLTPQEDQQVHDFREQVIYPAICEAWRPVTKEPKWQAYLHRILNTHEDFLASLSCSTLDDRPSGEKRIGELLTEVLDESRAQRDAIRLMKDESVTRRRHKEFSVTQVRETGWFANQFTTTLCTKLDIAAGLFTSDLKRALVRHLRNGNLPIDAQEDDLLEFMDSYGVEKLAAEGRQIRLETPASQKHRPPRVNKRKQVMRQINNQRRPRE